MGGDRNRVHIISNEGVETLEEMPKSAVAMALAERIAAAFQAEVAE
jgi:phosphopantothenoylcysteine decarboxylase/phosphopantothenate--cysteine ligase